MLFVYDLALKNETMEEIRRAQVCDSMRVEPLRPETFLSSVRTLTHHKKIIVPSSLPNCSPIVERVRVIAHQCGIDVMNLTAYLASVNYHPATNRPVAAAAVPPAQQHVAAGQTP